MSRIGIDDGTVKERENKLDPKPKKKVEQPKHHQVILENKNVGKPIPCAECMLRVVFNMSEMEARMHSLKAAMHGREIVMVTTQEVAESKASQANHFSAKKDGGCKVMLQSVNVVTEPQP